MADSTTHTIDDTELEPTTYIRSILDNPYTPAARGKITRLNNQEILTNEDVNQIVSSLDLNDIRAGKTVETLISTDKFTCDHAIDLLKRAPNRFSDINNISASWFLERDLLDEEGIIYVISNIAPDEYIGHFYKFLETLAVQDRFTPEIFREYLKSAIWDDQVAYLCEHLISKQLFPKNLIPELINYDFEHTEDFLKVIRRLQESKLLSRQDRVKFLAKAISRGIGNEENIGETIISTPLDFRLTPEETKYIATQTGVIWCGKVGSGNQMYAVANGKDRYLEIVAGCTEWEGIIGSDDDPLVAIEGNISGLPEQWDHATPQQLGGWRRSVKNSLDRIRALEPVAREGAIQR